MKSVLRSLHVLEVVSKTQPVSVGELSKTLLLPKSTVQRTLVTLHEAGWLRASEGDVTRWEISAHVLGIRPRALRGNHLYAIAHGPMVALRDATNETVHLSIPDGLERVVLIDRVDCDRAVRAYSPLGDMSPLHATATGKAILAHLPANDIETVLSRGLQRYSEATATDSAALRRELADIREIGYASNLAEYRAEVCAIGAAILDEHELPVASICISMPASRFDPAKEAHWGQITADAARQISSTRMRTH